MTIDKAIIHPLTDRLVTTYWRLHSYRTAVACTRGGAARRPVATAHQDIPDPPVTSTSGNGVAPPLRGTGVRF